MGLIINLDDFEFGETLIALDPSQEVDLLEYIERAESNYLPKMFGLELYDLFIADWNSAPVGQPTDPRFVKVFEPLLVQDKNVMVDSLGISEMLKMIVYYTFLRDNVTRSTTLGLAQNTGENSDPVNAIGHDTTRRFNEAMDTYHSVQYYMRDFDKDTYPEFNGVKVSYANIF